MAARRGRPKKARTEPKAKLQSDVKLDTKRLIQWAACRRGENFGQIIDWMAETMRKQLEAA